MRKVVGSKFKVNQIMLDFSIAMLIIANSLAWLLPVSSNALAIIMLFVLLFFSVGSKLKIQSYHSKYIVFISLALFVESFILTGYGALDEDTRKYFVEFVTLGIPSLFMANTNFRPYKVMGYVCVLSVPMLFYIRGIDMLTSRIDYGYWMSISYGIVKYIIVLCFAVFFVKKFNPAIKLGLLVILFLYVLFYLEFASRGAIVAVVISVVLFYLVKKDYTVKKTILVLTVFAMVLYTLFFVIIQGLYELFNSYGIKSFALEKMLFMEDVTNGRENIYKQGLEIFMNSPIIGSGAGIFEREYSEGYVHNCLIQFLDEGGVVYFVIILCVIMKSFKFLLDRRIQKEERYFMAFLISSGFVQLLFSSYFWGAQCFWLMIGYTFFLSNKLKRLSHENSSSSI